MHFRGPEDYGGSPNDLDMGVMSCDEYNGADRDSQKYLLMWVDGYIGGGNDNTMTSAPWMKELRAHVRAYCRAHSDATVISVAKDFPEIPLEGRDALDIRCREIVSDREALGRTVFWTGGFLSALSGDMVFSGEWQTAVADLLGGYCSRNPNKSLRQAIQAMKN